MSVVITSKFYQDSAWKDTSKIVFTSPNLDSPAIAGTRSHILPGQGDLGLWYEDTSYMYRIAEDQSTTYADDDMQATPMAKIDLYTGQTFSFVTDSSVLITLESTSGLSLGEGDVLYYDKDNHAEVDGITTLYTTVVVTEDDQIIVYDDPFFAGANARKGSTYNLYWTSSGLYTDSFVDIYYSINAGLDWVSLVSGTNNDGVISFNIPTNTTDAKIKIVSSSDSSVEAFSDVFTINNIAINSLKPSSSQSVVSGNKLRVWWNSSNFYLNEPISISFSTNSGISWVPLESNIQNKGYVDVYISAVTSSQCQIKIFTESNPYVSEELSPIFSCSYFSQSIDILYPSSGITTLRGETVPIYWSTTAMQNEVDNLVVSLSTDGGSNYYTLVSGVQNTGHYDVLIPSTTSSGTDCKIKISKDEGLIEGVSDNFTISDSYITNLYPTVSSGIIVSNLEPETNFWWNTNLRSGENIEIYNSAGGVVSSGTSFSGHAAVSLPINSVDTYYIKHINDEGNVTVSGTTGSVTREVFITTSGVSEVISDSDRSYSCVTSSGILYSVNNSGIHVRDLYNHSYEFIPLNSVDTFEFMIAVKQDSIYLYDKTQEYFYLYHTSTGVFEPKDTLPALLNIKSFSDSDDYIYGINDYNKVYRYSISTNTWSFFYETNGAHLNGYPKRGIAKLGDTDYMVIKGENGLFYEITYGVVCQQSDSATLEFGLYKYCSDLVAVPYTTSSGIGHIFVVGTKAEYQAYSLDDLLVSRAYTYEIDFDTHVVTFTLTAFLSEVYDFIGDFITFTRGPGTGSEQALKRAYFSNNRNYDLLNVPGENSIFIVSDSVEETYQYYEDNNHCPYILEFSPSILQGTLCNGNSIRYLGKTNNKLYLENHYVNIDDKLYIAGGYETLLPFYTLDLSQQPFTISGTCNNSFYNCSNSDYIDSDYYYGLSKSGMVSDGNDTIYLTVGTGSNSFYKVSISTSTITNLTDAPVPTTAGDSEIVFNSGVNKIYYVADKTLYISGMFEYDVSGDSWSFITNEAFSWPQKASLLSLGNYVYMLANGDSNSFIRMNVTSGNTLSVLSSPSQMGYNKLITDGTYIYAVFKDSPYYVCKYNPSLDVWEDWHKYNGITDIRFCFYKENYIWLFHGTDDNLYLSKTPVGLKDYSRNIVPAEWVAPPAEHTTASGYGGYTYLDTSTPVGWSGPISTPTQASPVYDEEFWEIRSSAPTTPSPYAKVIQLVSKVGTETLTDDDSLYWWNLDTTTDSWVNYTNSIIFTVTNGECYDCRLTAWDDVSHSTTSNELLSTNRCKVNVVAFNSYCSIIDETESLFVPYEIIAAAAHDRLLKGNTSYYGDFDMIYRYQTNVYGDYLMFRPYLYNIDDSISYGVHDFVITFHYSYT